MDCWAAFSRRQIAAHKQWLEHFSKNDPKQDWSPQIENGMQPVFERAQKKLLHLGYATGFQGMTAILYFLEDARLMNLYKRVLEQFGIGNKPGNRGSYKVNMERFPKSRRLLETEQSDAILPLGWLQWMDAPDEMDQPDTTTDVAHVTNEAPPPPPEPQYFTGKINHQKPPELDAVITVPGRPNKVRVYLSPDNTPELPLNGYANPLEEGTIILVRSQFNKEGKLLQVSFGRRK